MLLTAELDKGRGNEEEGEAEKGKGGEGERVKETMIFRVLDRRREKKVSEYHFNPGISHASLLLPV